jgi:hypothetical protein
MKEKARYFYYLEEEGKGDRLHAYERNVLSQLQIVRRDYHPY